MSPLAVILKMVKNGKITTDAAKELIHAVYPDTKRVTLRDVVQRHPIPPQWGGVGYVPPHIPMPMPVLCDTCKDAYKVYMFNSDTNLKGDVTVGGTLNTEA